MTKEQLIAAYRLYGFYSDSYRDQVLGEMARMSDDKQRELLNKLAERYGSFGGQIFAEYLTPQEMDTFNQIVFQEGGDLQVCCYNHPYEYMYCLPLYGELVFDRKVKNPSLQKIYNMMHVINAQRKFSKPVTTQELKEKLASGKLAAKVTKDFQKKYIDEMKIETAQYKKSLNHNTENEHPYGYGIDFSKLVDNSIAERYNGSYQTTYSQPTPIGLQTGGSTTMNVPFITPDGQFVSVGDERGTINEKEMVQPAQADDTIENYAPSWKDLVLSPEELEASTYGMGNPMEFGDLPSMEESIAHAKSVNPNTPPPVQFQQQQVVPQYAGVGALGNYYGAMPGGLMVPPAMQMAMPPAKDRASVKQQLLAKGIKLKTIGKHNPTVDAMAQNAITQKRDGSEEMKLSDLIPTMSANPPLSVPENATRAQIKAHGEEIARRSSPNDLNADIDQLMLPEPTVGEIEKLHNINFSEINKSLAVDQKMKLDKYKTPMERAREQATGVSMDPLVIGSTYAGPGQITTWNNYNSHMPDDVNNLYVPAYVYPGMEKQYIGATQEEIDNGYAPFVTVTVNGEMKNKELYEKYIEKRKRIREKNKEGYCAPGSPNVIIVRRRIVSKDAVAVGLNYKEASVISQAQKADDEDYALANELGRYNQLIADNFLWFKRNKSNLEFQNFKEDAIKMLMRYRTNDPAAELKSTVFDVNGKAVIEPPIPKRYTIEEMEKIASDCDERARKATNEAKAQEVIDAFQSQADAINEEIAKNEGIQLHKEKTIMGIIERLTAMRNIQVVPPGNEPINDVMSKLNPQEQDSAQRYKTWKYMKRLSWKGKPEEFDKAFDEWWYGSVPTTMDYKIRRYQRYKTAVSRVFADSVSNSVVIDPDVVKQKFREEVIKDWKDFEKGSVRDDMSLGEYLDNWGYMHTRMMERKLEEWRNNVTNQYNPDSYLNLVNKYSGRTEGDGKFDFVTSKEYNAKRQKFIDRIFHTMRRGAIA